MTSSGNIIQIQNLSKRYQDGFRALRSICLDIRKGEIFALLGPNGAGKTTLINMICGIVNIQEGEVKISGLDNIKDYRKTRAMIGLVPQELTSETFETVLSTVSFSRGLFGKKDNPSYVEKILRSLSLWNKKDNTILTLSGGMKRRVLIAKALAHEPKIIFLDEPTAGVDVELRQDMWEVVRQLKDDGVTIILTTHYIEEAEQIADRIGIINQGELILVKEKEDLMQELGKKHLQINLTKPLKQLPNELVDFEIELSPNNKQLIYTYDKINSIGVSLLLEHLSLLNIKYSDIDTKESSLEEIFVDLVNRERL
jgi:ABC-2 type transport system ATP-binding protein|tara:strand:+ start:2670 stop:3605 length:936 start_codon:yes stop_codon:yes gene_type:complete